MSPGLQKMFISLSTIGLMAVATVLITFARYKTKGIIRFVLSLVAFLLLIPILLYMLFFLFFL